MQSTNRFIVTPKNGTNFINEKNNFVVNTSIEEASNTNRIAIITSLPLIYNGNIEIGDEVIVHHNVFRDWFDSQGITRKSMNHFKDSLFYLDFQDIYLIKRNDKYITTNYYCFIKPIEEYDRWLGTFEVKHQGVVKYGNEFLLSQGVKENDTIAFKTDSEYEFEIDNEKLYMMRNPNIIAKLSA